MASAMLTPSLSRSLLQYSGVTFPQTAMEVKKPELNLLPSSSLVAMTSRL